MKVATGLAIGKKSFTRSRVITNAHARANADSLIDSNANLSTNLSTDLATEAVLSAMQKANISAPACVLLFLSSDFAANPQAAIKAAAKTANCTNVIGCSAIGLFTEEDWVIDSPAVAAMVFSENIFSRPNSDYAGLLLTLTAPNAIDTRWLNAGQNARFGGVSGDAIGQGAFSVWQNGKGLSQGYCEFALQHVQSAVAATHGLKLISNPRRITHCQGHDLINLANQLALNTLELAWLRHANATNTPVETSLPYHQLVAVYASKASLIERGDYHVSTLITGNDNNASVTLVNPMQVGDWLSWAIRDTDAAQLDLVKTASTLRRTLNAEPTFGLLFSSIGRGPSFYNGLDQDLALLKALFPKLPIIGFYGNGEIAHTQGNNVLFHNSAVLGLFC